MKIKNKKKVSHCLTREKKTTIKDKVSNQSKCPKCKFSLSTPSLQTHISQTKPFFKFIQPSSNLYNNARLCYKCNEQEEVLESGNKRKSHIS